MSRSFMDAIRGVVLNEGAKDKTDTGMTKDAKHFVDMHKVNDVGTKYLAQNDGERKTYEKMFNGDVDRATSNLGSYAPGEDVNKYVEYNEHVEIEEAKKAAKAKRGCDDDCDCDDCSSDDSKEEVKEGAAPRPNPEQRAKLDVHLADVAKQKKLAPMGQRGTTAPSIARDQIAAGKPSQGPVKPSAPAPAPAAQSGPKRPPPGGFLSPQAAQKQGFNWNVGTHGGVVAQKAPEGQKPKMDTSLRSSPAPKPSVSPVDPKSANAMRAQANKPSAVDPKSSNAMSAANKPGAATPPKPKLRPTTPQATKPQAAKPAKPAVKPQAAKPQAAKPAFKGNWVGAAPTAMQAGIKTKGPAGTGRKFNEMFEIEINGTSYSVSEAHASAIAAFVEKYGDISESGGASGGYFAWAQKKAQEPKTNPAIQRMNSQTPTYHPPVDASKQKTGPNAGLGQKPAAPSSAPKPKAKPAAPQAAAPKAKPAAPQAAKPQAAKPKLSPLQQQMKRSKSGRDAVAGPRNQMNSFEFEVNGNSYLVSETHASAIAAFVEKYGILEGTAGEFIHKEMKHPDKLTAKGKKQKIKQALAIYYSKKRRGENP